ncbi:MAG: M14 family metallocarboxypeptidase [Akkermansiaceae bacterium]|nr:M14 family metallocarboxypeptidase [Akkermansiaceae bacterium]NNM28049.1 M14 family metallocarboxypeptidase [Akkermansiaceae bacterium]
MAGGRGAGIRRVLKGKEQHYLRRHRAHDVDAVLRRWKAVARSAKLEMEVIAEEGGYPVAVLANEGAPADRPALYVSAGIHGDEPAAVSGLLEWAERRVAFLKAARVVIVPCLNPWGLVHNSRVDHAGRDLNRMFEGAGGGAVRPLLRYLDGREFSMAVSLHEDFDAAGVYVYELARRGDYHGEELLAAVEKEIPRHPGSVEGRRAENGVLRRTRGIEHIAEQIDGTPESIHLFLHHARTAMTFETPSEFSLYRRVRAHEAFLEGVRKMMSR